MSKIYIPFSEQQKDQARQTDLVSLLRDHGEKLKRSGSEYEWRDGSQKVTIRGNLWFHQYEQQGGDAVDFVQRYYGKSYPEAVKFLLNGGPGLIEKSSVAPSNEKALELPARNDNMRRAMAYLIYTRGIDRDIAAEFAHRKMIYESLPHHNVVFVGFDNSGSPRHANLRGTGKESTFKGNASGSAPEFSFHWTGTDDIFFLFESPIDMLSYITMHNSEWQRHSYAASCGVSDRVLFQMLEDNKNISTVFLCLDNDEAGQNASNRIADKLFIRGFKSEILVPVHKDWNEDLLLPEESEDEQECQALQFS